VPTFPVGHIMPHGMRPESAFSMLRLKLYVCYQFNNKVIFIFVTILHLLIDYVSVMD
jgi:hypothetical protein